MKNSFLSFSASILFVLSFGSSSEAASITVGNFTDFPNTNGIANTAGTFLNNTFVGVGYFNSLNDAQLGALNPTTFASILTGGEFIQFGSAIGWLGAGVYDGSASAAINSGSSFIGKGIYTLIGNAATLAASTELLIAKHPGVFAQDAPLFSAVATLDQSSGNGTVLWGNSAGGALDVGGGSSLASYRTVGVAAIPEPSRAMLAAMGLFAGLVRRRRK
jgi:hypothetical protein